MNKKKIVINEENENNKIQNYTWLILGIIFLIIFLLGSTYAFFSYVRSGLTNTLQTGTISFDFVETSNINLTNQFPIAETDIDSSNMVTFTITAHTTLTAGIRYNVYAVYGDAVANKTRLPDSAVLMKFTPAANGNGFATTVNNYATATTPTFTNGKCLISSGTIQNTSSSATKSYSLALWIDEDAINVSSTTKRATNAEGNPSVADGTSGTTTASRYMKNSNTLSTVTLYPAQSNQIGKIIYTTNEFSNRYYSIKVMVEAVDNLS